MQHLRSYHVVIEGVPLDAAVTDVTRSLVRASGIEPLNVVLESLEDGRRIAFVNLSQGEHIKLVLTPARSNFGIHVNGVRCAVFNVDQRYNSVHVGRLPRSDSLQLIHGNLKNTLASCGVATPLRIDVPMRTDNPSAHRGYATLTFNTHKEARAALEALRALPGSRVHYSTKTHNVGSYSLTPHAASASYDKMLHTIRERLKRTTELNQYYQALLEQNGFVIEADGKASLRDASLVGSTSGSLPPKSTSAGSAAAAAAAASAAVTASSAKDNGAAFDSPFEDAAAEQRWIDEMMDADLDTDVPWGEDRPTARRQ